VIVLSCYFLLFVFLEKVRLFSWGQWYWVASGDKKPEKPTDDKVDLTQANRKKIIFIRHGESEWNAVFNVGSKLLLPVRFFIALFKEIGMIFSRDSLFIDSPLSSVGIEQGWELMKFFSSQPDGCQDKDSELRPVTKLSTEDLVAIIRGETKNSVVVSSILRRAISTGLLTLSTRLINTPSSDKVKLMTCLQEISRNVDTLSVTPANTLPLIPVKEEKEKHIGDIIADFYRTRLDKTFNKGNKTLKMKAGVRQKEFTKWAFEQNYETIIVCGHSLWFREFFKSFLPKSSSHQAKLLKMQNCGVVAFDVYKTKGGVVRIDEASIKEVYGGFEQKGKKKKKA